MASDYVDDFLRDERELFKRKETAAKKFDNRLDNFRKSAQALRDAARQFEKAFPGMSRTMIADKLAMTGTEKTSRSTRRASSSPCRAEETPRPPDPNRKPTPNLRPPPRRIRKRPDLTCRRTQPNPVPRTTDVPHGRPATTDDRM